MRNLIWGIAIAVMLAIGVLNSSSKEYESELLSDTELKVNNFFNIHSDVLSEEQRLSVLEILNDSTMSVEDRVEYINEILDNYKSKIK